MYAGPDEWYFFATADPLRDEQITVIAAGDMIPDPDTPLVRRMSVEQAKRILEIAKGSMSIQLPSIPAEIADAPPQSKSVEMPAGWPAERCLVHDMNIANRRCRRCGISEKELITRPYYR